MSEENDEKREAEGRKAEERAVRAKSLLEDPMIVEALEDLLAGCRRRWERASTQAERDEERRLLHAGRAFESYLKRAVTRGAAAAAARLERERRAARVVRRIFA